MLDLLTKMRYVIKCKSKNKNLQFEYRTLRPKRRSVLPYRQQERSVTAMAVSAINLIKTSGFIAWLHGILSELLRVFNLCSFSLYLKQNIGNKRAYPLHQISEHNCIVYSPCWPIVSYEPRPPVIGCIDPAICIAVSDFVFRHR